MTQLLEKAVAKVSALPDSEQDALASVLLTEMESEQQWDQLFAASQDLLGMMAREAVEGYRAGKTEPLDLQRDFPKN
jgi:hypothetical protein